MRIVKEPEVFLVATTKLTETGLSDYLKAIGGPDWHPGADVSDAENLIEAGGRICYRSWQPYDETKPEATNPNVKKVREGNGPYIKNILESRHGSVLEHCCATFIFKDISRVFSHELVRNRAGMAFSQESLRYVRLTDLSFRFPGIVAPDQPSWLRDKFIEVVKYLEGVQKELAEHEFDFDGQTLSLETTKDFHFKKMMTSAFRRLAPLGLATSIMVTGNLRSWRHVIEQRTSEAAEEEIRLVIGKVAVILKNEYPNVFQDMKCDKNGSWIFESSKV